MVVKLVFKKKGLAEQLSKICKLEGITESNYEVTVWLKEPVPPEIEKKILKILNERWEFELSSSEGLPPGLMRLKRLVNPKLLSSEDTTS